MDKTLKTALIIGGVVVAVLVVLSILPWLFWGGQGYGMMGPWMMGGFGTMFLMPVLWIAIIGLIVWAVVVAVRRSGGTESGGSTGRTEDSALEILKQRYARGEIDKEEYEARKKDLA